MHNNSYKNPIHIHICLGFSVVRSQSKHPCALEQKIAQRQSSPLNFRFSVILSSLHNFIRITGPYFPYLCSLFIFIPVTSLLLLLLLLMWLFLFLYYNRILRCSHFQNSKNAVRWSHFFFLSAWWINFILSVCGYILAIYLLYYTLICYILH